MKYVNNLGLIHLRLSMKISLKDGFRLLILANGIISASITYLITSNILYNIEKASASIFIILLYGLLWFFSLYKIYKFSKFGLKIYIILVILGYLFNILSNFKDFNQLFYILSLTEHLVIGSILTFTFFTKIKSYYK